MLARKPGTIFPPVWCDVPSGRRDTAPWLPLMWLRHDGVATQIGLRPVDRWKDAIPLGMPQSHGSDPGERLQTRGSQGSVFLVLLGIGLVLRRLIAVCPRGPAFFLVVVVVRVPFCFFLFFHFFCCRIDPASRRSISPVDHKKTKHPQPEDCQPSSRLPSRCHRDTCVLHPRARFHHLSPPLAKADLRAATPAQTHRHTDSRLRSDLKLYIHTSRTYIPLHASVSKDARPHKPGMGAQAFRFGTDRWDPTHRFETSWLLSPWALFACRALFVSRNHR
jgi:hypothetical protein